MLRLELYLLNVENVDIQGLAVRNVRVATDPVRPESTTPEATGSSEFMES